jgi:hypothetical protein
MPQDINQGSIYNTYTPSLGDTADILVALTNYHYGVTDGQPVADNSVVSGANGIAGLFKSKANLAGPTFTGTVTLPSTTSIGTVTSTQIGYLSGVSSAIQTQLDAKAPKASPTFTGKVIVDGYTQGPTTSIVPLFYQPAAQSVTSGTSAISASDLLQGILVVNLSGNKSFALPTGTDLDSAVTTAIGSENLAVGLSFIWYIARQGATGYGLTLTTSTGHGMVAPGSSPYVPWADGPASFLTRRTGPNSWVTYWLGR